MCLLKKTNILLQCFKHLCENLFLACFKWKMQIQERSFSTPSFGPWRLFSSLIQNGNPAAQSRQPSALSNAWSSNLPDYLTTLALIQSNNGVPNWGPNHATKRTVELLNQSGSTPVLHHTRIQDDSENAQCGFHQLIALVLICALQAGSACRQSKPADNACSPQTSPTLILEVKCFLCRRGNVLAAVAAMLSEATINGNPTLLQRFSRMCM